jgi:hypothetical protein
VTVILFFISAVSDFCSALIASRVAGIVSKLPNQSLSFSIFIMLSWCFLGHVHQVFDEICVRH